jgi:hypothetical protein
MEAPPLQVRRQPRRGVEVGPVPGVGVAGQRTVEEPARRPLRRGLAGLGQLGVHWRRGRRAVAADPPGPPDPTWSRRRVGPPVRSPRPREWREHLVRLARPRPNLARRHGVRGPDADEVGLPPAQLGGDTLVPLAPVRPEVLGHEHGVRADLGDESGHHVLGTPRPHDQLAVDVGVERSQAICHEGEPRRPGAPGQPIVMAEQRDDLATGRRVPGGGGERRVVSQAQVAPEPHDGPGHPPALHGPEEAAGRRSDVWARRLGAATRSRALSRAPGRTRSSRRRRPADLTRGCLGGR